MAPRSSEFARIYWKFSWLFFVKALSVLAADADRIEAACSASRLSEDLVKEQPSSETRGSGDATGTPISGLTQR